MSKSASGIFPIDKRIELRKKQLIRLPEILDDCLEHHQLDLSNNQLTSLPFAMVIQTQGKVVPVAVGSDINCGMRLYVVDLSLDDFLAQRDKFVNLMCGDYFLGTRDVTMTAANSQSMFDNGIPGWLEQMEKAPLGSVAKSDFAQLWQEIDRVQFLCSLQGNAR